MEQRWLQAGLRPSDDSLPTSFPEWILREVDRLLNARAEADTKEEQAQVDLKLAIVFDAAHRFGQSLTEVSEI